MAKAAAKANQTKEAETTTNQGEMPWTEEKTAVTVPEQRELNNLQARNYYEQFGDSISQRPVTGKLLKFSKGDYYAGQDMEEVPLGTKLVAVMTSLETGWIKWVDNKPERSVLGLIGEGFVPPKREELGDTDEALWDIDESSGKPRDPWNLTIQLIMQPLDWDGEDDNLFTFVTQSRGGLNAVGQLSKAYGAKIRQQPGLFPVVKLEKDQYAHPEKKFGIIKTPQLTIADWVEASSK